MQELCQKNGLPTQFDERVIKEGWVGKAKGALQVLFECGWIDPDKIHLYTAKGNKQGQYSIDSLMQMQVDFSSEKTLLDYHALLWGVIIIRSPKCHPEIAGEGIEYGWALSKMEDRRSPMNEKRTKVKFRDLVQRCLDSGSVLNLKQMRSCSKKARDYMVLYRAVESLNFEEIDGNGSEVVMNKHAILEDSMKLYRRLQQTRKTHRSVLDSQVYDIRMMERENPIDIHLDSKEHLIRCVVNKMVTL